MRNEPQESPKPVIVVARDGDIAISLVEFAREGSSSEQPFHVGLIFRAQLSPNEPLSLLVVILDQILLPQLKEKAEELGVSEDELLIQISAHAVGDYLDQGFYPVKPQDRRSPPIIDGDGTAQTYFERLRKALPEDAEILAYIAKKVYWGWRYRDIATVFQLADARRMGIPLADFARVALAGDGIYWDRTDSHSLELTPTAKLLKDVPTGAFPGLDRPLLPRISERLTAPRYEAARVHFQRALELFDQSPPDMANALKEATAAVESVALRVTGRKSGTLGDCLKDLRVGGQLKPQLVKSLESLWGFVNEEPGVRHGKTTAANVAESEATFMLSLAGSAIVLLLELDK